MRYHARHRLADERHPTQDGPAEDGDRRASNAVVAVSVAFGPWSDAPVQETFLRRIKERILTDKHPIAVCRQERALTSAQLSKRAKIEAARLGAIEREFLAPTREELARLVEVLRATIELLIVEQGAASALAEWSAPSRPND